MEEDVKNLGDYLDIVRRHKYLVIIPAIILILATFVVAYSLPATYKSEGLILIESQEIPSDLIKSTVTSYASQRIEVIKQKIMTTSRVMELVNKYKLYPDLRAKKRPASEYVAEFRNSIRIKMVQANVTDPRSGRARRASIAFTVSFIDKSPQLAQKIANELVTQFLNENVRTRTDRASETKAFLQAEGDKFQRKIQLLEQKIAEFKDQYSDSLPELLQYNLSMVERLEEELADNQNQMIVLKDQIMTMSLALANIQPYLTNKQQLQVTGDTSVSSAESQLIGARAKYSQLSAKYSENHPDLLQLKRQIESLESETSEDLSDVERISAELAATTSKLDELSQRYSKSHPDVKAIKAQIKELELQLSSAQNEADKYIAVAKPSRQAKKVMSPAYVQIKSRIDSSEREIRRLQTRQVEIKAKLANFESRIDKTHQVKRAYDDLTRDRANNLAKYQELRSKQLSAELAENLESENKGESFTLIEPPTVPSKPEKINRPKILIMGIGGSIGAGVGLALLVEFLFGGVRGYNQITQSLGSAPLVVIPMIKTLDDLQRKRKIKKRIAVLLVLAAIAMIAVFHFYVMDLEVLWFKIMRKLSLL